MTASPVRVAAVDDHPSVLAGVEAIVSADDRLSFVAGATSHEELLAKLMYLLNSGAQRIAMGVNAVGRNLAVALGQAVEQKKFSE